MTTERYLPGGPPPVLADAYGALGPLYAVALRPHLLGGTSSEVLSAWFSRAGHPVSARTIRRYRSSLEGSV